MKGKIKSLIVILLLIDLTGVAQNIPGERKPIPGAEEIYLAELKASRPGVERIESLLKLSTYYAYPSEFGKKEFDKAIFYGSQARKLSATLNYQDGLNEARLLIASSYLKSGQDSSGQLMLDTAFADITKVRQQYKTQGQSEREVRALRQLSTVHLLRDQYDLTEATLLEIIKIFRSNGFPNVHYTYERLTELNLKQEKWDKSLLYGLEAIKSMKITGDSVCAGIFYFNLGLVYNQVGQFQKSVDCHDAAFNFFKAYNNALAYEIFDGKSWAMQKMKKFEEVILLAKEFSKKYPPTNNAESRLLELVWGNSYRTLKQYELAEPHYIKIIELQKLDNARDTWVYKAVGQFYAEWGKFEKARPYLETALKVMRPSAHLHFLMYMTDSAQGNYQSAMRHLLENKKLDDSAYYATKTRAIQEMQVKYEADMKDRDLAFLKQENLLQQAKVQEAATTRNMFIGGAIMLMLLLVVGYSRYRLKQHANQEMNKKNLALEHLVKEKEWLLKEVHHRVKNNLQTVLSLLESQSRYLTNDALHAIQNSQNRVYAMSLIHKKLYQSSDVAAINMEDYLRELVSHLRDSFGPEQKIKFNLNLEPIELDVSQAVPLGLMVNEAITNSIKYAFPEKHQENQITVSINQSVNKEVELLISDNGIGFPDAYNQKESSGSLGLKLIKGLTEDIEGRFSMRSESGLEILIRFVANVPLHKLGEMNLTQPIAQEV